MSADVERDVELARAGVEDRTVPRSFASGSASTATSTG